MAGFNDPVLPPEIWREILARLPVKSVLRCRSVCKSWYSLISCSDFISLHITNLPDKDGNRFVVQLLRGDESGDMFFSSHDESCEHEDDCPVEILGRDLIIVGSCNGLICLTEPVCWHAQVSTLTFLLWNPAIRKLVKLPSLSYHSSTQHPSLVGFGFDSNTGDYKVLCNLLKRGSGGNNDFEIFDLSKGVWRSIGPLVPSHRVMCPDADCYVNGAVHWAVDKNVTEIVWVILSFNMSDESFREIRLPDCAEFDDARVRTRCMALGGLVHVIVYKMDRKGHFVDLSESCSVWAMKEYGMAESWVKLSNIDLRIAQVLPSTRSHPRDFILWAKQEILMVHYLRGADDEDFRYKIDLVLYNTESRTSKRIFLVTKCLKGLCLYKESLVLM